MTAAGSAEQVASRVQLPYAPLCIVLGLVLGWIPLLIHGPAPEKFDVLYIQGSLAVWGWYIARMSIGLWVGITSWPAHWWLRGPLCGFLALLPLTVVSLAVPGCGWPCLAANLSSAVAIGAVIAGAARVLTGQDRLPASPP